MKHHNWANSCRIQNRLLRLALSRLQRRADHIGCGLRPDPSIPARCFAGNDEAERHAGLAQQAGLRQSLCRAQQARLARLPLDIQRLEFWGAAEEAAHELDRLGSCRVEGPRLARPELAHTQPMMLRLK